MHNAVGTKGPRVFAFHRLMDAESRARMAEAKLAQAEEVIAHLCAALPADHPALVAVRPFTDCAAQAGGE